MQLQTFKDYTVDYRLKQFRHCPGGWENLGPIKFINFKEPKGDALLCEMLALGLVPDNQMNQLI